MVGEMSARQFLRLVEAIEVNGVVTDVRSIPMHHEQIKPIFLKRLHATPFEPLKNAQKSHLVFPLSAM